MFSADSRARLYYWQSFATLAMCASHRFTDHHGPNPLLPFIPCQKVESRSILETKQVDMLIPNRLVGYSRHHQRADTVGGLQSSWCTANMSPPQAPISVSLHGSRDI